MDARWKENHGLKLCLCSMHATIVNVNKSWEFRDNSDTGLDLEPLRSWEDIFEGKNTCKCVYVCVLFLAR